MFNCKLTSDERISIDSNGEDLGELLFSFHDDKAYVSWIKFNEDVEHGDSFRFLIDIAAQIKDVLKEYKPSIRSVVWSNFPKVKDLDEYVLGIDNNYNKSKVVANKR